MWRLWRRWLKRQIGGKAPRARESGRNRFIAGRFKDPRAAHGPGLRAGLGYRLFLPSGSASRGSLPLLVMLHGCRQRAADFAEGSRMNALAEQARCAVLYPEQSRRFNPQLCWNWFEPAALQGEGEAGLLARLIEQVALRRPIDARRVYLAGMSAGGAMACVLAVTHSRLFAACAIHSGLMYGAARSPMEALEAMRSARSAAQMQEARRIAQASGAGEFMVPTLLIQGDRDTSVHPCNADQLLEQLQARAQSIEPGAGALQGSAERRIEEGGRAYRQQDYRQRGRLVLRKIVIEGLGHAWSGGDGRHEFNDARGPEASRLILDFVMQYERDAAAVDAARAE